MNLTRLGLCAPLMLGLAGCGTADETPGTTTTDPSLSTSSVAPTSSSPTVTPVTPTTGGTTPSTPAVTPTSTPVTPTTSPVGVTPTPTVTGQPTPGPQPTGSNTSPSSTSTPTAPGSSTTTATTTPDPTSDSTGGDTPVTPGSPVDCTFDIKAQISATMATVGVVTWTTDLAGLDSAQIEFGPAGKDASMVAPVDLSATDHRTLLLGMKQNHDYVFHVVAKAGDKTCVSDDQTLKTGTLNGATTVTHSGGDGAGGFIITSPGLGNSPVYIFDADGDVVWSLAGPGQTSRAHMSYNGDQMWMLSLNVQNSGGEVRYVTMEGTDPKSISGLSKAHHDFCVLPNNGIATMIWTANGADPPSDLVEWSPDGNIKTVVRIDQQVYQSNTYHSNAIHYYPSDDTYTISDRNPNVYVKIDRQGKVLWQFGGTTCTGAPAAACALGSWCVNHGHHWLDDGTFVLFTNNGPTSGTCSGGFGGGGTSTVMEFKLSTSGSTLTPTKVHEWTGNSSMVLGDVQRLPNGNTLITWSNSGVIDEKDANGQTVRSFSAASKNFGYADWRPTLYGAAPRL